ncbi:hypothetical protein [Kribbella sp. CA-294648]|uniref:hypothetical protein n=1 Tax=Kribbella sp. CA-294648 TaxID=3239948 RepID=UPI003D946D90
MKVRALLIALASITVIALGAGPAHAYHPDLFQCQTLWHDGGYYKGCFRPTGELFNAFDGDEDGASAEVVWWTSTGRNGVCTNSSGYLTWRGGTTDVFHNPCGPADIREGVTVYWKACFHDLSKGDPRVCVNNP